MKPFTAERRWIKKDMPEIYEIIYDTENYADKHQDFFQCKNCPWNFSEVRFRTD